MGKDKDKKDKKDDKKPIKIAGVKIGSKLGAGDVARIQEAKPNISIAAIQQKAKNADVKIISGAQSIFKADAQKRADDAQILADEARERERQRQTEHLTELGFLDESGKPVHGAAWSNLPSPSGILPGQAVANYTDFVLGREGANLETQKEIERIRNAGASERLKYEVDNRIPEIQAESKGRLDLQAIVNAGAYERLKYEVDNRIPEIQAESKGRLDLQSIVNAGYKNIANIERGTEMVRNITSMFNF